MVVTINANPGQTVIIYAQVLDGYGSRDDGYQAPQIEYILNPSQSQASGYPRFMTRLAKGLYYHSISFAQSSSVIGTYLVSITWPHPDNDIFQFEIYQIQVSIPFGNSSVYPA